MHEKYSVVASNAKVLMESIYLEPKVRLRAGALGALGHRLEYHSPDYLFSDSQNPS